MTATIADQIVSNVIFELTGLDLGGAGGTADATNGDATNGDGG